MILIFIFAFLLLFIVTLLFKNLSFVYDKSNRLFLDSLDTTIFSWITSLFFYCFIFNKSIGDVASISKSFYLLINLVLCIFVLLVNGYFHSEYFHQYLKITKRKRRLKKGILLRLSIYSLVLLISLLTYNSSVWLVHTFGEVTIEQLLYSMQTLSGSNIQQVFSYINGPLVTTVFFIYLFVRTYLFFFYNHLSLVKFTNRQRAPRKKFLGKFTFPCIIVSILFTSIFLSINQVGLAQVKLYFSASELIQNEYINPKTAKISFNDKKRNLIYIFVESLETSYTNKAIGGNQKDNFIAELTNMIGDEAINFSNTNKVGGALQVPGTEYTAAGIVAQTSGMPLKAPQEFTKTEGVDGFDNENNFGMDESYNSGKSSFLPGLTSLGDILNKENYNQKFIMGSDATFGGRRAYLSQHGNYDIVDLLSAREKGYIPSDYAVWWGFEDEKLFSIAKKEVDILAKKEEPFNLTLLTADTHFPDGYITDETPRIYDNQYANVISNSSKQIADFINWCKEQSFYENTTIIISGDHLTMDQNFINSLPSDYERTVFNLFINSPLTPEKSTNRQFATIDLFPTTLASLGANIPTNRLGIGTNLFSNKETVIEKYSIQSIREELSKQSKFYTQNILESKQKVSPSTPKENKTNKTSNSVTQTTSESSVAPSSDEEVTSSQASEETIIE